MVLLSLALLASALTGVLAQTGCRYGPSTSNQSGINNGFYYTWATEIDNDSSGCPYGSGNITLSTGGRYTVEWNGMGLTYGGKGWSKGSNDRVITYQGTINVSGNFGFGVYGWTRNPLVEYYILENWPYLHPGSVNTRMDANPTVEWEGSLYDLSYRRRYNQPSIDGTANYTLVYAVRRQKRSSGAIYFKTFADAWEKGGVTLGEHNYQIVQTEGYYSVGSASMLVGGFDVPKNVTCPVDVPKPEEPKPTTSTKKPKPTKL